MKLRILIYNIGLYGIILMSCNSLIAQVNLSGDLTNNGFLNKTKPKVSVSLSTSFSSFGYGYSAIGTSIMPQITFPVTNKFSLRTGIGYSTFFMAGNGESMLNSSPSNYGHVFVSGDYLLNEKITLRGTAYKTFNLNSKTPGIEPVGTLYDFSSQGVIMDVEYKVTDNFRINVGFEYRQQNYPMYSPNGYPMMSGMGN
ncbi:MAG: hypothetical protein HQ521_13355, partial [Bacteroidetes bacterium]|nr:hypothetical protein [Bacteroidota bacterium]